MIRIAYLVLAHHQPDQCRRLLRALASDSSRLFVHVDAKVDWKPFLLDHPQVTFVRRRRIVNRGGWSLTAAMIDTLREAFVASESDYFIFLAGTDYPIKSRTQIAKFLEFRYPLNFINYYPLLDGTSGSTNLTRYHFVDQSVWLARLLRISMKAPERRLEMFPRSVDRLNAVLPARAFPTGGVPFRGSDRWCLTRDAVRHVLQHWDSGESSVYKRYFKYTWGSDEMVFQTVIFNSEIASQCYLYDGEAVEAMLEGRREPWSDEVKSYLHYIDWDPCRDDPAILDERDRARLRETDALFACKFDEVRSAMLLDWIDEDLLVK
jgi:hypothetical protein